MRITDLYWRRYRIPFRRTFTNRYEQIAYREGAILFMETDAGVRGIGEVAPMQGFGGTLDPVLAVLKQIRSALIGTPLDESGYWNLSWAVQAESSDTAASQILLSGLCLAFFDALAQAKQQSLATYLNGGQPTASHIPVNATLGGATIAELQAQAAQAVAQGFTCIKMKVGAARDVHGEIERVKAVREMIGDGITLRVDANGAWTFEQAVSMLEAFTAAGVALVEQPIAPAHIVGLRLLRERFPTLAIAADESITDINSANQVLKSDAADVVVLKPMAVGGVGDAVMIANLAIKQGVGVIITSLLDSGIGIAGALQVAAALPPPLLPCGLATADLLERTLIRESLSPINGYLAVPQGVGVGVTLDETQLEELVER